MHRNAMFPFLLAAGLWAGIACAQEAAQPQPAADPAQPAADAAAQPSADELEFRHELHLDDYATVEFRDEEGRKVGFEAILMSIPHGKTFSIRKDKAQSLAVVQIDNAASKQDAGGSHASLQPGQPLPMPEGLRTLDGGPFGAAELHGRRTLLSLYFAECLPCIAEVPELNALAAAHPGMGAYAVTFDDASTAKQFVAERGLQLPVVADAQAWLDALGVRTYPTLVLVDEQGRIAAVRHGGAMGSDGTAADSGIAAWMAAATAPAAGAP